MQITSEILAGIAVNLRFLVQSYNAGLDPVYNRILLWLNPKIMNKQDMQFELRSRTEHVEQLLTHLRMLEERLETCGIAELCHAKPFLRLKQFVQDYQDLVKFGQTMAEGLREDLVK